MHLLTVQSPLRESTEEIFDDSEIEMMSAKNNDAPAVRSRPTSSTLPNGFSGPCYIDTGQSGTPSPEPVNDEKGGLRRLQPAFLQRFATAKCLLVFLSLAAFTQAMIINGLINVVITTIEKRFSLASQDTGLIASSYDIACLIVLLPVSYFGGHGQRSKWLGIGMAIVGFGSLLFSVPHFLVDNYQVAGNLTDLCVLGARSPPPQCRSPLSRMKNFFIFAQLLHGLGSAPLYTLGVAFLDDSVPQKMSSMYVGIYYACSMLGPAVGYLVGGQLLKIYIDFDRVTT
ncbi:hypothetical protein RvY_15869 [Ramazzottius varieornatus]|uniref:Major facilitator superfamily (MFS) profile domain-containing protein n=1 Tax=Ramazzottius varieornatus TaxID=947166 RepID=A0A1D1W349_RAMVA|nr:hypothetical protein RvY_15869 [Ramazzottius varieornatus]